MKELQEFRVEVDICDPRADGEEVKREYLMEGKELKMENYDGIILAVVHNEFKELEEELKKIRYNNRM